MSTRSRRLSLSLAVLVLLVGAGWIYWWPICCAPPPLAAKQVETAGILAEFHTTCLREARKANGGGALALDAATEDKLVGYCDCVAAAMTTRISPAELEKLGLGEQAEATNAAIGAVVAECQAQHLR